MPDIPADKTMGGFRGARASGTAIGAYGQRLSWSIVVVASDP